MIAPGSAWAPALAPEDLGKSLDARAWRTQMREIRSRIAQQPARP
jgi:hypothetical protein